MKKVFLSLALMFGLVAVAPPCFATVTSTVSKIVYTGTGSVSSYAFTFNVFSATDLVLTQIALDGTETLLVLNSNYTVSLSHTAPTPGTITLTAGSLAAGVQLVIQRVLPLTQQVNITDYSPTPAATWNEVHDRAVMDIQQLQEQVSRAVKTDITQTSTFTWPTPVANLAIGWNDLGTGLKNVAIAGPQGPAGTIAVGSVQSGQTAAVVNAGSSTNAIFNFTLPLGATGPQGIQGAMGAQGPAGPLGPGGGDVLAPATNHKWYVPVWGDVNSKVLVDGFPYGHTGANTILETGADGYIYASVVPTLNQDTSGNALTATSATTAGNLSGTPALPNGTTATTQSQADASTKLATTAYVDTAIYGKLDKTGTAADSSKLQGYTLGTGGNQIVQLDAYAKLPAVDGSQLTNIATFGSWATKANDTSYLASTDGIVVAWSTAGIAGQPFSIIVYSDSANPPTVIRQQMAKSSVAPGDYFSVCCPVKKGDYYKVTTVNSYLPSQPVIYFIPTGS
jgi:hypothetical protein